MYEALEGSTKPFDIIVKRGFATDDGQKEYMWVALDSRISGGFSGVLLDQPLGVSDLREGQTVRVLQEDVVDWLLRVGDEPMKGGFTVCYLALALKDPASQALLDKRPHSCDWALAYEKKKGAA